MKTQILCTLWGLEHLPLEDSFLKVKQAGYDGVDAWIPEDAAERKKFIRLLDEYQFPIVCHQHQATGTDIKSFCKSFEYYLNLSMECNPILINSHSGKDYFSKDEQLRVIDTAQEFSVKRNIRVAHETHRGRIGFSPYNAMELFALRPDMKITADLSHWVCVTESYLENCPNILEEAIKRTEHIHARVGYPEGPQVTDPRVKEWQTATQIFLEWWGKIIDYKKEAGDELLTITPEFGPPPYMVTLPSNGMPVADQFEINSYMKDLLRSIT
ncbi:sugar phosphate isomerase/epimerase [Pedobacter panaciterrae]|jgi:sugar phosphate isomerase/epimerase|uniref:sugar phosphate isomerase/epimerase family protein n=1 Tax=Pedobacter panaciterrae TaxID=363849 RepID=UPI00155D8B63|nr:sugar phosphate isomerase/epimerase [Pedobacter panaciterrae]NQX57021.1 sugar phosphate isomerase/epimerase [Pedobacter panaciterrae]